MDTWSSVLRHSPHSGTLAALASTAVLGVGSILEHGTPYPPVNAVSHWLWGDRAFRQDGPSVRYTLAGYATHHASAILWAALYEKLFGNRAARGETAAAIAGGLGVAALACFVDYKLTPRRLQPGFEQRLEKPKLFLMYGSFGLALALRGLAARRRQ